MAEKQPPTIVEGATAVDVDDEIPLAAKSAEDRKAQAALSSLDAPRDDDSSSKDVDQEAVRKAMDRLAGTGSSNGTTTMKEDEKKAVKKNAKVDPADVTLLIEELELTKPKATEFLKAHDGNADQALRAFITPPV